MALDNVLELEVRLKQAQTVRELEQLRKKLREVAKDATIGSTEQAKALDLVASAQNRVDAAMERGLSVQGKVKKSYFELGQQLRSAQMAGMNMGRVFSDMPYGIQGVSNNIEPLVFSLKQLSTEAKAAGLTMKQALLKQTLMFSCRRRLL